MRPSRSRPPRGWASRPGPRTGKRSWRARTWTSSADLLFLNVRTAGMGIDAGTIRPLAVTGPRRLDRWPDVPTMAESGFPRHRDHALARALRVGRRRAGHAAGALSHLGRRAGRAGRERSLPRRRRSADPERGPRGVRRGPARGDDAVAGRAGRDRPGARRVIGGHALSSHVAVVLAVAQDPQSAGSPGRLGAARPLAGMAPGRAPSAPRGRGEIWAERLMRLLTSGY